MQYKTFSRTVDPDEIMPYGYTWWFTILTSRGKRVQIPKMQSNVSPRTGQHFDRACPFDELGMKYMKMRVGNTFVAVCSKHVTKHCYERHLQAYAMSDQSLEEIAAGIDTRIQALLAAERMQLSQGLKDSLSVFVANRMDERDKRLYYPNDPRVLKVVEEQWPAIANLLDAAITGDAK